MTIGQEPDRAACHRGRRTDTDLSRGTNPCDADGGRIVSCELTCPEGCPDRSEVWCQAAAVTRKVFGRVRYILVANAAHVTRPGFAHEGKRTSSLTRRWALAATALAGLAANELGEVGTDRPQDRAFALTREITGLPRKPPAGFSVRTGPARDAGNYHWRARKHLALRFDDRIVSRSAIRPEEVKIPSNPSPNSGPDLGEEGRTPARHATPECLGSAAHSSFTRTLSAEVGGGLTRDRNTRLPAVPLGDRGENTRPSRKGFRP